MVAFFVEDIVVDINVVVEDVVSVVVEDVIVVITGAAVVAVATVVDDIIWSSPSVYIKADDDVDSLIAVDVPTRNAAVPNW